MLLILYILCIQVNGLRSSINVMEDNGNNFDNTAMLEELQKINQGITAVNTSQKELTEYLISKDKLAEQQKKIDAEEQAKSDEDQAKIDEEQAKVDEAKEQQDLSYTEQEIQLLTEINNGIQLNNQIGSVNILIFGIICGLLFMKIFIDRLVK